MIPVFEPTEACAKCKGNCCKHMGCHFSPSDFEEVTYDALAAEIEKGYISIDWWEGDRNLYFLRMRNKKAPIVDPSWGGECKLLTDKGCPLPFEKRPLGARSLEPSEDGRCISHYGKYDCAKEWLKYDRILQKLVERFE